jgi:hypothetical protein
VSARGWIKRGEAREVCTNTGRQRLNINGATDLDRLAPVVPLEETINADSTIALFKKRERLNLAATQERGHHLVDPSSAQRRLSASLYSKMTSMALCLCLGLLGAGCGPSLATKADNVAPNVAPMPSPMFNANYSKDADVPFVMAPKTAMADGSRQANFASESASRRARDMGDWVVRSRDNLNMPFAIVDKVNAEAYVFGVDGQLRGAAPVLLGLGLGDDVAPGIGNMRMSSISPAERTTPAGRFVAKMGRNAHGKEVLWVDYKNAISMHPVITSRPQDRRPQRLATPSPLDNRISFGCINVPAKFFEDVIHSMFSGTPGIVYILPETKGVR